jgi:translation initiation factor 2B subunit (eIF-2B alpha/beta/delta family)
MAKSSVKEREKKREQLIKRYEKKRKEIKQQIINGFDGDITAVSCMSRTLCRLVNHSKQNIIADNYDYALAA